VIHNFKQEGQGEHATKIKKKKKKKKGKRNKVNCVSLNPCTQKKERKLKHAEKGSVQKYK
jgi:hypothetical protein